KLTNASISRRCGDSPGPGGFLRKSPTSLPALKESPTPCQSTTWTDSSLSASSKISAKLVYILPVRAFFLAGRFNSTRRMPPVDSVLTSLMVAPRSWLSASGRPILCFRYGPACAQGIDVVRVKPQLLEDLVVVLAECRSAPSPHFGDAMNLNRTADGRLQ